MTYSQDSVVKVLCALRRLAARGLPRTLLLLQSRKPILPNLPHGVNPFIGSGRVPNPLRGGPKVEDEEDCTPIRQRTEARTMGHRRAGRSSPFSAPFDEIGCSLRHGKHRKVEVRSDGIGHYRCVGDPQSVDPVDPAVLVHHRQRII